MKRVNPGDPLQIRAADWNRLQQVATFVESGGWLQGQGRGGAARVLIKNSSGSDVDRFGILGISDVAIDETENLAEFQNNWCLVGDTVTTSYAAKFAVAQEPITNGNIGWCVIAGPTVCQVDINDADDVYADAIADATQLSSASAGSARIIYKPSGTGTKWCVVHVGKEAGGTRLAKGTITARSGATPGSGTVTIQTLAGGNITATSDTVTAYSMSASATATNTYVHISYCNLTQAWWLVSEDCP